MKDLITILDVILDGLTRVDARVQRVVDVGMHALMRRGASKAMIRYVVGVMATMSFVIASRCSLYVFPRSMFSGYIPSAIVVVLLVVTIHRERRLDEREALGLTTLVHRPLGSGYFRWMYWVSLFFDVGRLTGLIRAANTHGVSLDLWHRWVLSQVVADVFFLFFLYSMKTSPQPPMRQVRAKFSLLSISGHT